MAYLFVFCFLSLKNAEVLRYLISIKRTRKCLPNPDDDANINKIEATKADDGFKSMTKLISRQERIQDQRSVRTRFTKNYEWPKSRVLNKISQNKLSKYAQITILLAGES